MGKGRSKQRVRLYWTIPEVREDIEKVIAELRGGESLGANYMIDKLSFWEKQMHRRKAVGRAPPHSAHMTPELSEKILACWRKHPHWGHRRIGNVFNVAIGRVSESVAGFRR